MPLSPRRLAGGRPLHSRWSTLGAAALVSLGLVVAPSAAAAATSDGPTDSDQVIGGALLARPGPVVGQAPGVPPLPATTATSFIVADADTGAVLASLNAHEKLAPASTLKTLTALTLLPRLDASRPTMAQSDAPSTDGTKAGIVAGTMYKVGDLFTAMLMMSANDAAVSLADANGGIDPTLQEMNAQAAHLNARDTVARTPDGLDAPGQSSSAYDLALIFRQGLGNVQFRHYLSLTRAAFPAPGGKSFQIQTHDKLLTSYPGMVGGKNGYTVAAQASYVGAATRDGHTIIVAVMRDQPNFWPEVKALLDWGFAADAVAPSIGVLVAPGALPTASPSAAAASGAAKDAPLPTGTGGAAGAAGPAARTGGNAKAASGLGVGRIMTWAAVGFGGLVFLGALARVVLGRRRSLDEDGYLAGLSRLSGLGQVSDRS